MAKRKRPLPPRKRRDRSRDEESLLHRSAESLGRAIGLLQRQLDSATRRLSATATGAWESIPSLPDEKAARRGTKKRSATNKGAGAKDTKGAASKRVREAPVAKKTRQR